LKKLTVLLAVAGMLLGARESLAAGTPKADAKADLGSGVFVSVETGYDSIFLGQMGSDMKSLVDALPSFGDNNSLGMDNSGIQLRGSVGLKLDATSSLSLGFENTWSGTSGVDPTSGPDTGDRISITPSLLGINLNYGLVLLDNGGWKTTLKVGGGYYHGSVHYILGFPSNQTVGDFGADGVGGTLGISEDLSLGGGLSLGVDARFRVADLGKMTAKTYTQGGVTQNSGPYTLASAYLTNGGTSYYIVEPVPSNASISSPNHFTDMDFSGITGGLSLKLAL
jgi:hypothetical protein